MCAIFGIAGADEAANLTYLGLHALQHRGQEGSGIITNHAGQPYAVRKQGLVGDIFTTETMRDLKGRTAIGHNRYSTTGANSANNLQPLLMRSSLGWVSVAHNGNLTNATELTLALEGEGSIFQSTSDTEVIVHLLARSKEKDLAAALTQALKRVEGAYSLLVMNGKKLIAVRDPYGWRPLVLGNLRGAPVFASETCAFDLIGADYVRELEPGEMVVVDQEDPSKQESLFPFGKKEKRRCVFEHIYFARPDSTLYGTNVHAVRKALGRKLAEEQPAPGAEVVIPVPDSGVPAAIGYAEWAKIPFDMGIIRSHYIGRTFIEPKQSIRDFGVKLKLNPIRDAVEGKSVVVVDDSLVRGTTSRKLITHFREAGASEVHLRISAPPTTHPCFYGINTPTKKELLASNQNLDQIRRYVGADTLGYISLAGVLEVTEKASGPGFCHACFSGEYPTRIPAA